jgi:hypothetical protein
MGKDDITISYFGKDVDNKKLSNKQLAKKAEAIAKKRNEESDTKEKFKKLKEDRKKEMEEYDYERKKPLIDEIAKKRTATEGSFKKGGLVKQGKPKLSKKRMEIMIKKIKNKICEIICKVFKIKPVCVVMNVVVKRITNNETRTICKHSRKKKKN